MTYYGSRMVVEHYNMMGPVKAALESATRYMAAELGPKKVPRACDLSRPAQVD
jgi:enoyl-[acyl-carrier protein] reductase I